MHSLRVCRYDQTGGSGSGKSAFIYQHIIRQSLDNPEKKYLVIVPEDASDGTKKKYTNMCDYYGVPILVTGTKETLGRALGKEERSVISVNDANFAQAIMNLCAGNK